MIKYILFFISISFFLHSNEEVQNKLANEVKIIDFILTSYELDGNEYFVGWDYHVGFLNGKRAAYVDCLKKMKKAD